MAKKVVKHPNKVGKVGPKEKPEREKKMQIILNLKNGDVEDRGGIEAVKELFYSYFEKMKKVK